MKAKKLIEVALPIKEISAESVRDNRLSGGNIRTLHIWWARRPLPVCRAVVFASLVPDPLDEFCPEAFKCAVDMLLNTGLGKLHYKPYKDIPYTNLIDEMEDNHRNRLMMFIGKFSDKCQKNMITGKITTPKEQLDDYSLIKWENRNNPNVLRTARELIFVAYQSSNRPSATWTQLHGEFNKLYDAIFQAENNLNNLPDRHIETDKVKQLELELKTAIKSFQDEMPSVFDPFAGGGAIPLEAARLGCRSYGNDINPVAHIIEKGSAEFPQKFGKQIVYSKSEFIEIYGKEGIQMAQDKDSNIIFDGDFYTLPNRLLFDVSFYANKIIKNSKDEIGKFYPNDDYGNTATAYYWARNSICSNPSCKASIPMLRNFYLCNTNRNHIYLKPKISDTQIEFDIVNGKYSTIDLPEWNRHGTITCPCCGSVTNVKDIKEQSRLYGLQPKFYGVISETKNGREYSMPSERIKSIIENELIEVNGPEDLMPQNDTQNIKVPFWGFRKWKDLFSSRQLRAIQTFVKYFNEVKSSLSESEYDRAVITYLAIWIDRLVLFNTMFSRWNDTSEKIQHVFGRQAISMLFDFVESNPFCTSSGSASNQLDLVLKYIDSESTSPFSACFANSSSGDKLQFDKKSLTAVVTDPPYYDAIAYSDCSDFFYVWLKQTLGDVYPLNFSTPLTPKSEECTAIKHRHNGNEVAARKHFETKLTEIFDAIELQTSDIVSIMYAHQSTEAWTTLCNSILDSRMNITGSWALDTEMAGGLKTNKAYLESSVTVACRPSERKGYADFGNIRHEIKKVVKDEVEKLYELGFRGADLLTACFGQAVSVFGKYKSVEKADGSEVTVAELLDMARNAAFDSLLTGIQGDDFTKFYIGWLQLNGTGETDFDDATKFTRIGVNVNIKDIHQEGLLILDGKKMHIAMAEEHLGKSSVVGTRPEDSPISQAHRLILNYREGDRGKILHFVRTICPEASSPLWRLLSTLKELLPANDDYKQISGILQNADDLRQHCHEELKAVEGDLFEGMEI